MAWLRDRRWAPFLRLVRPELGLIQPTPRPVVEGIVRRMIPGATDDWAAAGVDEFLRSFRLPRSSLFLALGTEEAEVGAAEAEWNTEMRLHPLPPLMAGAESLLASMAALGIRVGVISAADLDVVLSDARKLGISGKLDFVIGSAKSKSTVIAELVNGGAAHVAYLGDTEHDVREANEAGATSIGFIFVAPASKNANDFEVFVRHQRARRERHVARGDPRGDRVA